MSEETPESKLRLIVGEKSDTNPILEGENENQEINIDLHQTPTTIADGLAYLEAAFSQIETISKFSTKDQNRIDENIMAVSILLLNARYNNDFELEKSEHTHQTDLVMRVWDRLNSLDDEAIKNLPYPLKREFYILKARIDDTMKSFAYDERTGKTDQTNSVYVHMLRKFAHMPGLAAGYGWALSPTHAMSDPEAYLAKRVEEQRNMEHLGDVLSAANSVEELLSLLSKFSDQKIIVNKNVGYRQEYPIAQIIKAIQGSVLEQNLEKQLFDQGFQKTMTDTKARTINLKKQKLAGQGGHQLTRVIGDFNLRQFVSDSYIKDMKLPIAYWEATGKHMPIEKRNSWTQLVWYVDSVIPADHVFRFHTATEGNVAEVETTITAQELKDIILNAPLGTAHLERLPTPAQVATPNSDTGILTELRAKLDAMFH